MRLALELLQPPATLRTAALELLQELLGGLLNPPVYQAFAMVRACVRQHSLHALTHVRAHVFNPCALYLPLGQSACARGDLQRRRRICLPWCQWLLATARTSAARTVTVCPQHTGRRRTQVDSIS